MTAYEIYQEIGTAKKTEYYEIAIQKNVGNIEGACKIIQDCFECDKQTAEEVIAIMNKRVEDSLRSKGIEPLTSKQKALNNERERLNRLAQQNKPKCPTCSSTNVQKIGTGERAVSVAVLGIFSKKINKSFKCKNCGYAW
ncbi:MAG: hypothetical protein K2G16_06020 [Lachnospiraceae bacterium]|nr:hypothetical protein [Lachnospiraceae bacterium]